MLPVKPSRTVLVGIRLLHAEGAAFILLPMVMASAGIIVALFYKMTPENHRLVVKEIERLENGGSKQDVDNQTRAVCECLTGLSYDALYGGRQW